MASVEKNQEVWGDWPWKLAGDEWSKRWGGADQQWWGTIFPRLLAFLPARTVLEIAPGYGRWTRYLVHMCERLIGLDVSPNCIERCRERFAAYEHASFHVNDGYSLEPAPDGEVDLAFSFDSLVHAEEDVLAAYARELSRTLAPNGVGFIHHSNAGAYVDPDSGRLPFDNVSWRARTASAAGFARVCEDAGLVCVAQEIVRWDIEPLTDCFSVVTRRGSAFERPNQVHENDRFSEEAERLKEVAELYAADTFTGVRRSPEEIDESVAGLFGR
jgi:SAM-dependent methyltransferase